MKPVIKNKNLKAVTRLIATIALLFMAMPVSAADEIDAGYLLAPKAFRAAVAVVQPSLVTIESYGTSTLPVPKKKGRSIGGISRPGEGPTTGLIVSPDGYIITSTFNFIRKPKVITVTLSDGTRKVAKLLGKDETRKLAILKIENVKDLPVPKFVQLDDLKVGQWTVSVGVGYGGTDPAISKGIISALNRISGKAVQTDANISPANYGGPLIDIDGQVIGICAPLSPRAKTAGGGSGWYDSGIGFAVPLAGADHLIERMKKGETIKPGLMGITPNPKPLKGGGVKIKTVAPKSPASKSQLKPGDIIKKINGKNIFDLLQLMIEIGRYNDGDTVVVELIRKNKPIGTKITLEAGPFKKATPKKPEKPEKKPEVKDQTKDETKKKEEQPEPAEEKPSEEKEDGSS